MATATIYCTKEHSIADTGTFEVGTSKEVHAPIGKYTTGWDYKELLRFPMSASDFNGITQITSAVLKVKTTDTVHCANDNGSTVRVRGLNGSFAATGGGTSDGSDSWRTDASPVWPISLIGTTATLGSRTGTWNNLTVYEIDITDYVEKYGPPGILKRDGTPCDNEANYGMTLDTNGSTTDSVEFKSMRGSYTPRIVVTGTTTPVPEPPVNHSPTGTWAGTSLPTSADFSWDGDAADENPLSSWDMRMSKSSASSGGVLTSAEVYLVMDNTTGISARDVAAPTFSFLEALARGTTYYWQVRHENSENVNGDWSSIVSFYIPNVPDAPTWMDPTVAKPYAHISNLDDDSIWTDSGGEAIAELSFQYNHPDGLAMDDFTIDWGGVEYTKTDFGFAADKTWADGETVTVPAPAAQARGSANSVNAFITATDTNGNESAASSTVAVVTQWAQAIVQENHGSGAGNFEFAQGTVTGGTASRVAFLFRKGDGTPGAWTDDIGAVAYSTHLDVLCRLGTNDSTNNPQLPDFTVSYLGTGNLAPDLWTISGTAATLVLDSNKRRFGRRSAKVLIGSTETVLYPDYGTTDPDIIVTSEQDYVFSVYLQASVGITDPVLRFYNSAGVALQSESVSFTEDSEWHRISSTIEVPAGVTRIRPAIVFAAADSGKEVWVDSAQLEEGTLVTQWKPGGIGPAVSIDVGGIQVDASKGGVFRLLSSDEGNAIYAGAEGLTFKEQATGSESDVYISGGDLQVNTDLDVTGAITATTDITATGDLAGDNFAARSPVFRVYATGDSPATWTKPTTGDFLGIMVEVQGGGGGGGGTTCGTAGYAASAGGGGAGAYAKKFLSAADLASDSSLTVTIGDRGTGGGTGSNGGTGGTSSVAGNFTGSPVQCTGGSGGVGFATGTSGNSAKSGGDEGTPSGGDIHIPGGKGGDSRIISGDVIRPGDGGASHMGAGGRGGFNGNGDYGSGQGYGGGGGGGSQTGSSTNRTGGYGGYGRVTILEYYA